MAKAIHELENGNELDKNDLFAIERVEGENHVGRKIEAGQLLSVYPSSESELGHWSFEEDSGIPQDYTFNANHLTLNNGTSYVAGISGKGLDFERDSGQYANNPECRPSGDAFTIACWFKLESLNLYQHFVSVGGSAWDIWLRVWDGNTLKPGFIDIDGVQHDFFGDTVLTAGAWYHAAFTYDGTDAKVYLNGKLDGSFSPGVSVRNTGSALFIGCSSSYTNAMDGTLDEVHLWERVLSNKEIRGLYYLKK